METRLAGVDYDGVAALLRGLLNDLDARYGALDDDVAEAWLRAPSPDEVSPPEGAFAVATVAGVDGLAGCGAIRRYDEHTAEVKRMYTVTAARRLGVAQAILAHLDLAAAGLGYRRMRLETGAAQPEAIALYRRVGYEPIPPYGEHVGDPLSRCFEKPVPARAPRPAPPARRAAAP